MTERCPYCAKPLEEDTLTSRVLAALAPGIPMSPAALSRMLDARRTMVYQTIRRLRERGSIVRKIDPTTGESGWVAAEFPDRPEAQGSSTDLAQDPQIQEWASEAWAYMGAREGVSDESAISMLRNRGAGPEEAAFVVGAVRKEMRDRELG